MQTVLQTAAILTALLTAATSARADDPKAPDVIKDLVPGYDIQGDVPSVLGISPGMTIADANAVLGKLAKTGEIIPDDEIPGLRDPNNGRGFSFLYHRTDHIEVGVPVGMSYLDVIYTTAASGGRVAVIKRNDSYETRGVTPSDMPNEDALTKSIIDKYGPPTDQPGGPDKPGEARLLRYAWVDGQLKAGDDKAGDACNGLAGTAPSYLYRDRRRDDLPNCTMQLTFEIIPSSHQYNAVAQLNVILFDYRRVYDDAVIADKFMLDGLNEASAVTNGPQPNL